MQIYSFRFMNSSENALMAMKLLAFSIQSNTATPLF